MTIRDIARKAGVSTATVSRYFNSPDVLSSATQNNIKQIVDDTHYRPNALARGLIRNETRTIGVINPDINNAFYPPVIRGLEDYLHANNYSVFVCNTDSDITKEKSYITTLMENRVDGIVFLGTRPTDPEKNIHVIDLSNRIPVVVVSEELDPNSEQCNLTCVCSNESDGAYEGVKYLLELGHRRIAYFTSSYDISTYLRKYIGYKRALQEYGIDIDKDIIFFESPYADGGFRAINRMLLLRDCPTAVFNASDQMAIGALKALSVHGLRVPHDISLVGYSGVSIGVDVYPEMTTIDQNPYLMGQLAAKHLIEMILGKSPHFEKDIVPIKLIVRDSCRAFTPSSNAKT